MNIKQQIKKQLHFFFTKLYRKQTDKKQIILLVQAQTMEYHIQRWIEATKEIDDIELYISCSYPGYSYRKNWLKAKELARKWNQYRKLVPFSQYYWLNKWNLIVSADYQAGIQGVSSPFLFINHGLHMISYDGGNSTYTYGKAAFYENSGVPIATKILESNSYISGQMHSKETWKEIVEFVGSKDSDRLEEEQKRREEYRKKIGIHPNERFIVVFGSWDKDSLFHYLGNSLITELSHMLTSNYKVALSIHPLEYLEDSAYQSKVQDCTQKPLGKYVDNLSQKGFIIRKPKEDYVPYLIASDLVISDYSSLAELAVLARKKLMLSYFPIEKVWKTSMIARIRKNVPIIYQDSPVEKMINNYLSSDMVLAMQEKFRQEIYVKKNVYNERVKRITRELLETSYEEK